MDQHIRDAIFKRVEQEPFARALKMKLVALDNGYSAVEMTYEPAVMGNIYDRAHGGAIFALIDLFQGRTIEDISSAPEWRTDDLPRALAEQTGTTSSWAFARILVAPERLSSLLPG